MRKIVVFWSLLLFILAFTSGAGAQDKSDKAPAAAAPAEPLHYYHFDFVVEDLNAAGTVINSRSYSTTVDTEPHYLTSIRAGSRVPIATASYVAKATPAPVTQTQFQYVDVGVDFDVRDVHEVGGQLAFDLTANLSGVSSPSDPNLHQPVFRLNKWQSRVLIPIGKRTVVFTSDSLDSKGSTRVVVTATPLE